MQTKMMLGIVACAACVAQADIDLNGSWSFRFEEGKAIEETAGPAFEATDTMTVPGCYDTMPKWFLKRGTGLYRRTFTLAEPVKNAWLVVDGMGRGLGGISGKIGQDSLDGAGEPFIVGLYGIADHEKTAAKRNCGERSPRPVGLRPGADVVGVQLIDDALQRPEARQFVLLKQQALPIGVGVGADAAGVNEADVFREGAPAGQEERVLAGFFPSDLKEAAQTFPRLLLGDVAFADSVAQGVEAGVP